MGREKFSFLGPYTTPEVPLRLICTIFLFKCFTMFCQYPFGYLFLKCILYVKIYKMQMWEGLVQKAKDGGLDVIDTYVFWNLHEPSPGNVVSFFFISVFVFGSFF